MKKDVVPDRRFFHSFPRPKAEESEDATLERGLGILAFMKELGLVLAPEIVAWDVSAISGGAKQLRLLQRRACLTELSVAELPPHCATFGPIALSFDISKLRCAGATPVIYVPQGVEASALSQIPTFCVNAAYHTKYVLRQLDALKELSDPMLVAKKSRMPVAPNVELNLDNPDPVSKAITRYTVPASNVRNVLQFIGFRNIPFDHSIGMLSILLNMFYPTDNAHTGDELGYYRQREWRLIAGDINLGGRPIGRSLSGSEVARLQTIDRDFWTRQLIVDGVPLQRSALALLYEPTPAWNFFELVEAILVPKHAVKRVRALVGDKVTVHSQGSWWSRLWPR